MEALRADVTPVVDAGMLQGVLVYRSVILLGTSF